MRNLNCLIIFLLSINSSALARTTISEQLDRLTMSFEQSIIKMNIFQSIKEVLFNPSLPQEAYSNSLKELNDRIETEKNIEVQLVYLELAYDLQLEWDKFYLQRLQKAEKNKLLKGVRGGVLSGGLLAWLLNSPLKRLPPQFRWIGLGRYLLPGLGAATGDRIANQIQTQLQLPPAPVTFFDFENPDTSKLVQEAHSEAFSWVFATLAFPVINKVVNTTFNISAANFQAWRTMPAPSLPCVGRFGSFFTGLGSTEWVSAPLPKPSVSSRFLMNRGTVSFLTSAGLSVVAMGEADQAFKNYLDRQRKQDLINRLKDFDDLVKTGYFKAKEITAISLEFTTEQYKEELKRLSPLFDFVRDTLFENKQINRELAQANFPGFLKILNEFLDRMRPFMAGYESLKNDQELGTQSYISSKKENFGVLLLNNIHLLRLEKHPQAQIESQILWFHAQSYAEDFKTLQDLCLSSKRLFYLGQTVEALQFLTTGQTVQLALEEGL